MLGPHPEVLHSNIPKAAGWLSTRGSFCSIVLWPWHSQSTVDPRVNWEREKPGPCGLVLVVRPFSSPTSHTPSPTPTRNEKPRGIPMPREKSESAKRKTPAAGRGGGGLAVSRCPLSLLGLGLGPVAMACELARCCCYYWLLVSGIQYTTPIYNIQLPVRSPRTRRTPSVSSQHTIHHTPTIRRSTPRTSHVSASHTPTCPSCPRHSPSTTTSPMAVRASWPAADITGPSAFVFVSTHQGPPVSACSGTSLRFVAGPLPEPP